MASSLQYVTDQSGGTYIPATQRPDGTWRKARRVKDGYVPQEEVPLYESKGKQWARDRANYIPGYNPVEESPKPASSPASDPNHIPGLNPPPSTKSSAKKKKKKKAAQEKELVEPSKNDAQPATPVSPPIAASYNEIEDLANDVTNLNIYKDPSKRIRNLKKRLREIDALAAKIESGEVPLPDKDQLEKIARRKDIEAEIEELEALVDE